MTEIVYFLIMMTVLVQLGAAVLSYFVFRVYKLSWDWLFITSAFLFMALQGILQISIVMGAFPNNLLYLYLSQTLFPFAIGVCFLVGFWGLLRDKSSFISMVKRLLSGLRR